jgi:hypothetical protein
MGRAPHDMDATRGMRPAGPVLCHTLCLQTSSHSAWLPCTLLRIWVHAHASAARASGGRWASTADSRSEFSCSRWSRCAILDGSQGEGPSSFERDATSVVGPTAPGAQPCSTRELHRGGRQGSHAQRNSAVMLWTTRQAVKIGNAGEVALCRPASPAFRTCKGDPRRGAAVACRRPLWQP